MTIIYKNTSNINISAQFSDDDDDENYYKTK